MIHIALNFKNKICLSHYASLGTFSNAFDSLQDTVHLRRCYTAAQIIY